MWLNPGEASGWQVLQHLVSTTLKIILEKLSSFRKKLNLSNKDFIFKVFWCRYSLTLFLFGMEWNWCGKFTAWSYWELLGDISRGGRKYKRYWTIKHDGTGTSSWNDPFEQSFFDRLGFWKVLHQWSRPRWIQGLSLTQCASGAMGGAELGSIVQMHFRTRI